MITFDEIKLIEDKLKDLEKPTQDTITVDIKTIDPSSYNIYSGDSIYIDSSYVHDIIGPYYYIFARAVAIGSNFEKRISDLIIIPDLFFEAEVKSKDDKLSIINESLSEFASIFSKNLEYRLAIENKNKLIFLDGSLLSDFIAHEKYFRIINEDLSKIYEEFKRNFRESTNLKIVSIAKRILSSRFFNEKDPDVLILMKKFPYEEFYTEIIEKEIEDKEKLIKKNVKMVYFRPKIQDHIYRLEAWDNLSNEELYSIINTYIKNIKRYPIGLKLAHNRCKITNKEKKILEEIIRKKLGYSISIGWDTK